jgi:subtilisin-like proprotein convertase family protein
MNTRNTLSLLAVTTLLGFCGTAMAQDNAVYGETRFNQLPARAKAAHKPWVGSWWAYTKNGISDRHKLRVFDECRGVDAAAETKAIVDQGKSFCLSASEKLDLLEGRVEKIEWTKIKDYHRITDEQLSPKQTQLRDLVRKLNKYIADNPNSDWRESDDGKAYLRIDGEITTAKAMLPSITVDTATEFEQIEHGHGVPGVQGWWGHCNAWAAASLMEAEPRVRGAVTHNGVTVEFTPGEAKGLLTESWMEHASSFHGSRHDDPENEGAAYEDLTPAAFHIYFGTQLGLQQKGFVIDRFTGDEVWNQPVRSYVWRTEKLYTDKAVKTKVVQTTYDRTSGDAKKRELGEIEVYPVQVTATFHWITDGVPHEELTVENVNVDAWPTTSNELHSLWGNQVEMRTLTYTLYLDKPMDDAAARIVGDGTWSNAMAKDDHAWPDFAWQPLSQGPSRRNYENPHIAYDTIVEAKILPATSQPVPVDMGSEELSAAGLPLDIPDNAPGGVSASIDVPDRGAIVTARARVKLTHTYRGDLRVVLSRGNDSVVLHDRTGDGDDDLDQTYDLPTFAGKASAGTWKLEVFDLAAQDVGRLTNFTLDLVTAQGGGMVEPPAPPAEQTREFAGAATPKAIPDGNRRGITSKAESNAEGTLVSARVIVDIKHPYKGDLVVALVRDGQTYTLHNRTGGGTDDVKQTFDVAALAGKAAKGTYTLKVQDVAKQDVGTLNGWRLELTWR